MPRLDKRWAALALGFLALVGIWQAWRLSHPEKSITLRGETMGTRYLITAHGRVGLDEAALRNMVEARLSEINAALSTWDPGSEISRFNRMPAGTEMTVSTDFRVVLKAALQLAEESGGAFDPTIGPLVNLWGFGPERGQTTPTEAEITAARARVDFRQVRLEGSNLQKDRAEVVLDLSAIAKGYGVDEVAQVVADQGFRNYLVEIGGEVRAWGMRPDGKPWRVGIENPVPEEERTGRDVVAKVALTKGALATSGSYRRFRQGGGHHIIDPRTGRSTNPHLVSVTVHAPNAMLADGIATALMVMGTREGQRWLDAQSGVKALFIRRNPAGGWEHHLSEGFGNLLIETGE